MKLKCDVERLNWTTAYSYNVDGKNVELTLPFETMKALCLKHSVFPNDGAREAQFAVFRDWVYRHRRTQEHFYGDKGFDILSLVDLFRDDLKGTAKIWDNTKPQRKKNNNETDNRF